eukprot:gene32851-42531_t
MDATSANEMRPTAGEVSPSRSTDQRAARDERKTSGSRTSATGTSRGAASRISGGVATVDWSIRRAWSAPQRPLPSNKYHPHKSRPTARGDSSRLSLFWPGDEVGELRDRSAGLNWRTVIRVKRDSPFAGSRNARGAAFPYLPMPSKKRSAPAAKATSAKSAPAKSSPGHALGLPKCSAHQWVRVVRIHALVNQLEHVKAQDLARELETSVRSIYRTAAFMRERLEVPIEYDRMEETYALTRPCPFLPMVMVEADEALVLKLVRHLLPAVAGAEVGARHERVLKKLAQVVGSKGSFVAESRPTVLVSTALPNAGEFQHLVVMNHAIDHREELRLLYRKSGAKQPDPRVVQPLDFAYLKQRWVLLALDEGRKGDLRTFRLDRIHAVALTGQTFQRPPGLDIAAKLRGNMGAYTGNGDYTVRLRLRSFAAEDARTCEWHTTQEKVECADGSLEITLQLNNLVDVARNVLEWCPHAEVLSPPELRASVREALRAGLASIPTCHSERSEESIGVFAPLKTPRRSSWILRFAQNDRPFRRPLMIGAVVVGYGAVPLLTKRATGSAAGRNFGSELRLIAEAARDCFRLLLYEFYDVGDCFGVVPLLTKRATGSAARRGVLAADRSRGNRKRHRALMGAATGFLPEDGALSGESGIVFPLRASPAEEGAREGFVGSFDCARCDASQFRKIFRVGIAGDQEHISAGHRHDDPAADHLGDGFPNFREENEGGLVVTAGREHHGPLALVGAHFEVQCAKIGQGALVKFVGREAEACKIAGAFDRGVFGGERDIGGDAFRKVDVDARNDGGRGFGGFVGEGHGSVAFLESGGDEDLVFVRDVVLVAVGEAFDAPRDGEAGDTVPVERHRPFTHRGVVAFPVTATCLFEDHFADVDTEGEGEAALALGGFVFLVIGVELAEDFLDLRDRGGAVVERDPVGVFGDGDGFVAERSDQLGEGRLDGFARATEKENGGDREERQDEESGNEFHSRNGGMIVMVGDRSSERTEPGGGGEGRKGTLMEFRQGAKLWA